MRMSFENLANIENLISLNELSFPSCLCNSDFRVVKANDIYLEKIRQENVLDYIKNPELFKTWLENIKNGDMYDSNYFTSRSGKNVLIFSRYIVDKSLFLLNFIKITDTITNKYKDLHDAYVLDKILSLEKIQELKHEIQLKNRLISIISHDIKNHLNSFLLLDDELIDDVKENCSEISIKKITLLSQVANSFIYYVNNLLNWVKASNKNMSATFEKIEVFDLINNVIDINSKHADEKNINILFSSISKAQIKTDETILTTILVNLLNNAIKFSLPHSNIYISLFNMKDEIEIVIQDRGIGISEEQQKHLFDPSIIKTTRGTKGEKGTGFGLIIVKELVEMLKGRIILISKEGVGTKVSLFFPKEIV